MENQIGDADNQIRDLESLNGYAESLIVDSVIQNGELEGLNGELESLNRDLGSQIGYSLSKLLGLVEPF